jgi:hypothetical protein
MWLFNMRLLLMSEFRHGHGCRIRTKAGICWPLAVSRSAILGLTGEIVGMLHPSHRYRWSSIVLFEVVA